MRTPEVGRTYRIRENGQDTGMVVIVSVSPKGQRCDGYMVGSGGSKRAFYRSQDSERFVESPGAGIAGAWLNPCFYLDGIVTKTVRAE